VDLENKKAQESKYGGKDYYFCCFHRKDEFEKETAKYIEDQKGTGCCC
jgi:YHS domain-containing protein